VLICSWLRTSLRTIICSTVTNLLRLSSRYFQPHDLSLGLFIHPNRFSVYYDYPIPIAIYDNLVYSHRSFLSEFVVIVTSRQPRWKLSVV